MINRKFQNIISSKNPVLVDFYADWCIPCKQVHAVLKEVKQSLNDNIRIIKVNVDENPLIATKYKIRSLPTVIIFKDGKERWSAKGAPHVKEIKEALENFMDDNNFHDQD